MPSNNFITEEILRTFKETLALVLAQDNCTVAREHKYIDKSFPFRGLHMTKVFGNNADEFFLDSNHQRIMNDRLNEDLSLLLLRDYHSRDDLSIEHGQEDNATSIADLYIHHPRCEIVIELETFRTKPFSNLIFIPATCGSERTTPLYVIQCFAPERRDLAARLTRRIGQWLNGRSDVHSFEYIPLDMPSPPDNIRYLLPKVSKCRPNKYNQADDKVTFRRYAEEFCKLSLIPSIRKILARH